MRLSSRLEASANEAAATREITTVFIVGTKTQETNVEMKHYKDSRKRPRRRKEAFVLTATSLDPSPAFRGLRAEYMSSLATVAETARY